MITDVEMTYSDMRKMINSGHLCSECQSLLTIAWGGSFHYNGYILRCGKNVNHKGITGHDKKYEERKREMLGMDSTALTTMDNQAMLARIDMAKFPKDLTISEKKLLAQAAITYGFDPLMGEMTIYQGKPFVSIDGRYRKAQETGQLDGVDTRPATKQEREDWQIKAGEIFFRAEVYVKGASHPFVGWGRVFVPETEIRPGNPGDAYKPTVTNPQRMAEKRAEAQALRKAFHINLPSVEDIGLSDYDIESTARVVDKNTGEITEGKNKQEPPPQPLESQKKPVDGESRGNGQEDKNRPPENAQDFSFWVSSHGKNFTPSWAAKQLGVKSVSEIADFKVAYTDLKSMAGWEG